MVSMIAKALKLLKVVASMQIGIATSFAAVGDSVSNPNPELYCGGKILDDDKDVFVAHPSLKCRSKVLLYSFRTHRSVVATVMDRGPRRALVDLAPRTTKLLHSNGKELVLLIPL